MLRLTIKIGQGKGAYVKLPRSLQLTPSELLAIGEREKTRIIRRTESGKDVRGVPFRPYSTKRPYYYYPSAGAPTVTRQRASARLLKRLNRRGTGARLTRSGKGIRFDSYAAFKRALGRTHPDLTGPRAPHMLQSMVVLTRGNQLVIGIYDQKKAKIAEGHNRGVEGRLPKREWLGISKEDRADMAKDATALVRNRIIGEGFFAGPAVYLKTRFGFGL